MLTLLCLEDMADTTHGQLRTLQSWMHAVVTGDGPYKGRLSYVEHLSGLGAQTVLTRGGRFPLQRRLGVYVAGYRMRLIECLRTDFPLLRKFMTEEVFDHFAGAYLHFKKSNSYTLFDLGDRFAEFLETTCPLEAREQPGTQILVELARYERTLMEVMRARGNEDEAAHEEGRAWETLFGLRQHKAAPALRLLECRFPIHHFARALREREDPPELPAPQATRRAISRVDFRIQVNSLPDGVDIRGFEPDASDEEAKVWSKLEF